MRMTCYEEGEGYELDAYSAFGDEEAKADCPYPLIRDKWYGHIWGDSQASDGTYEENPIQL